MRPQPPNPAAQMVFLNALEEWSGRSMQDFPKSAPPCSGVGSDGEDAILASVFASLANSAPYHAPSHSMALLTAAIQVHQRRFEAAWNSARSSKPGVAADRGAWSELRHYEAMIETLQDWLDALWTRSVGAAA